MAASYLLPTCLSKKVNAQSHLRLEAATHYTLCMHTRPCLAVALALGFKYDVAGGDYGDNPALLGGQANGLVRLRLGH